MAFDKDAFNRVTSPGNSNSFSIWSYRTSDASATYSASGYFQDKAFDLNSGDIVYIHEVGTGIAEYQVSAVSPAVTVEIATTLGAGNYRLFLDTDDDDHLETLDLTQGLPDGWAVSGNIPTFDSTGMHGTDAGIKNTTFAHGSNMYLEGSIIIQIERDPLAFNRLMDAADFKDFDGDPASSGNQFIFTTLPAPTEMAIWQQQDATKRKIQFRDDVAVYSGVHTRISDKVCPGFDPVYAELCFTWSGSDGYLLLDQLPILKWDRGTPVVGQFDQVFFGTDTAGGNGFEGAIKKIQFCSCSFIPTMSSTLFGLIGNSFVQDFTDQGLPVTKDQAGYDAVQQCLALDADYMDMSKAGYGDAQVWLQISRLSFAQKNRLIPKAYNASYNGTGWRSDAITPIVNGQLDALIAADPDVVIANGCTSDVLIADTTHDLIGDVKTKLNYLIDGCSNLTQVYFFLTWWTPKTINDGDRAAYEAEIAAQRALFVGQDYTRDNAASNTCTVTFIDSTPTWWDDNGEQNARYALGSHPDNDTASKVTPTVDGDVHMSLEGRQEKIPTIIWPYIKDHIAAPTEDTTAPTVSSVVIDSAGTTLTITMDEAVTGNTGFTMTVDGVSNTLSSPGGSGTTITFTCELVYDTQTVLLSYSPGNVVDASANALESFSDTAVTNNSTQTDPLGPELVTNGGFDSDSDWNKATGASISGGKLVYSGVAQNLSTTQACTESQSGITYEITYTISNYTDGPVRVSLGGVFGTERSANGTYTEQLTTNNTNANVFITARNATSTTLDIDDVSVRKVL